MFLLPVKRELLIGFLPKGGIVAEIGVAKGEFSAAILAQNKPAKLHLIDPWVFQARDDYANDVNNVTEEEAQGRYQSVLSLFEEEIKTGRVCVHREFSADACKKFDDASLDWAYIDGLHTYKGALADLENFAPKIKNGGFILGHDFANHNLALESGFGVVEAVGEFLKQRGWQMLAMTMELYPSYLLGRLPAEEDASGLIPSLLFNLPAIEIRDFDPAQFKYKSFRQDSRFSHVMSF